MGLEATCRMRLGARTGEGKALLETDHLRVRGDLKVVVPFASVTAVEASDGVLSVTWPEGTLRLHLGPAAEKWAARIRSPKALIDKLDVRPSARVAVIGIDDAAFRAQLAARTADVSTRLRKDLDALFVAIDDRAGLARLERLRAHIIPAGAIWVVRPKGTKAITDADVIAAAREAGLVDVKVAAFSATHTAEKLVIPRARREG